jgi:hypothetical protein
VGALRDHKVADYVNQHCVATFMKVGTFQIIGGQKVGGNVASYFCLSDGAVIHAVPGPAQAQEFMTEARWAIEARKNALTLSTDLATGRLDSAKYRSILQKGHEERYLTGDNPWRSRPPVAVVPGIINPHADGPASPLPRTMPHDVMPQMQVHWLLATHPLDKLENIYPTVWQDVLHERLSQLPVAMR